MIGTRLAVAIRLTALTLMRNRVAVALIVILPILFYALIAITTGDEPIAFKLPSVSDDTIVTVSRKHEGLVFMGLCAVGFISAFLGLHLISRQADVSRRLLLCGYHAWELVAARLAVLGGAVVFVSVLTGALLRAFFAPQHLVLVTAGFALVGFVYGCYGLLAGSVFKRELEAIFSIVLLTNIDVGWLQNPVFYSSAQHTEVIRALPAYLPAQVSMTAAFSDHSVLGAVGGGLAYGAVLLVLAVAVFWSRMRVARA